MAVEFDCGCRYEYNPATGRIEKYLCSKHQPKIYTLTEMLDRREQFVNTLFLKFWKL